MADQSPTPAPTALIINNTPQVLELWGVRLGAREDTEFRASFQQKVDPLTGKATIIPDKGEVSVTEKTVADWEASEKAAKLPIGSFRGTLRGLIANGVIRVYDSAGILGL